MRRSSFLMLIGAAVLGVIAVFIARMALSGPKQQVAVAQAMTTAVAASIPLSFGDKITKDNLKLVKLPPGAVPETAFRSVPAALGDGTRVAQRAIAANEVIIPTAISGTGNRLSTLGVIGPSMRAISVTLSEATGVGGLIAPGDHVDVYITRSPPEKAPRYDVVAIPGAPAPGSSAATALQASSISADGTTIARAGPRAAPAAGPTLVRATGTPEGEKPPPQTDLLIQDVRVLAIGQNMNVTTEKPELVKSATLEVTPEQVSKLTLGQTVGTLTLALRPLSDKARSVIPSLHVQDLHDGAAVRVAAVTAPRRAARAAPKAAAPSVEIVRAGVATGYVVPGGN